MKLTNEKIEQMIEHAKDELPYCLSNNTVESICTELLELRRLSEVIGDLEKRIMEGAQAQLQKFYDRNQHGFANASTKHISLDFHDGAHFVIPIIRAESKARIKSLIKLQNDEQEFFQKRDKEQRDKIASQARRLKNTEALTRCALN